MVFIFITIFPLIKPEKQVSGMPENIYIHFLTFISMENRWRRVLGSEGREFTHVCVDVPTYICVHVLAQFQACWPFPFQQLALPLTWAVTALRSADVNRNAGLEECSVELLTIVPLYS